MFGIYVKQPSLYSIIEHLALIDILHRYDATVACFHTHCIGKSGFDL
jgi:hypothetical protein